MGETVLAIFELLHNGSSSKVVHESVLVRQIRLWWLHGYTTLDGAVLAAGVVGVLAIAVTAVGAVGINRITGGLVSVHGITLHTLPVVPSRVRLHTVSVAHSRRRPSANRAAIAMAVSVAVTARLPLGKVTASGRITVLIVIASAVVAAPSAFVGAHAIGLVDAHGLRPAPVLAINGSLERADRVERTLPSGTSGIGQIRVGCAQMLADNGSFTIAMRTMMATKVQNNRTNDECNIPIGLPFESVCWKERRDCRVGFSSAAATGTAVSNGPVRSQDKHGTY